MRTDQSLHQPRHSTTALRAMLALATLTVLTTACGGVEAESTTVAPAAQASTATAPPAGGTTSAGVSAAASTGPVETKYFTTVLPEGWEILADVTLRSEDRRLTTLVLEGLPALKELFVDGAISPPAST